jgi:hemin uptake protein HemP
MTVNSHNTANFRLGEFRSPPVERAGSGRPAAVRTVTSESLFHGDHEISIDHRGAMYRLKITRQGKLILNK